MSREFNRTNRKAKRMSIMEQTATITACGSCAVVACNADTSHLDDETLETVSREIDTVCRENGALFLAWSHTDETYTNYRCDLCLTEQYGTAEVFETVGSRY